jgi:glyoxylase-like metal-dependent hydrolase (beta-lactamase superfamily II)
MDDAVDGMTEDPGVSLASRRAIKQLAQSEPTVLLPAHDPDAARRLAEGLITQANIGNKDSLWSMRRLLRGSARKCV